jgi:hypothetical protein
MGESPGLANAQLRALDLSHFGMPCHVVLIQYCRQGKDGVVALLRTP